MASFVYENICYRFGVPLEILSNRGAGFRGDLVRELMEKLGIARRHSTPYYPQCNGLVEKVNGMILRMITNNKFIISQRIGIGSYNLPYGPIKLHSRLPWDTHHSIWFLGRRPFCQLKFNFLA